MNVRQIEEKFAAIQGNSTYLRVSEDHPLELYLGLNDQGQKTLRFNGVFTPVKIVGNALLIIKQAVIVYYFHSTPKKTSLCFISCVRILLTKPMLVLRRMDMLR